MKKLSTFIGAILTLIPLNQTIIFKTTTLITPMGIAIAWTNKANAEQAEFLFERAQKNWDNNNLEAALEDYNKIINFYPDWYFLWAVYVNRADLKQNLKDYYSAYDDYTKSIELNPKHAPSYYQRGWISHKIISPTKPSKLVYGTNKLRNEAVEKAFFDYKKAIELDPNYKYAYYEAGKAIYLLNEFYVAIEYLEKYLKFEPNDLEGLFWLGESHLKTEQFMGAKPIPAYETALKYFDRLIAISNNKNNKTYLNALVSRSHARYILRDLYKQINNSTTNESTLLLNGACRDLKQALNAGVSYDSFAKLLIKDCL